MKSEVLEAIGAVDLRRATLVNAALAANERAKFLLSLLQFALAHAAHPEQAVADLRRERLVCGLAESWLDEVVAGARAAAAGRVQVPHAEAALQKLAAEVTAMAAPLAGGPFDARLAALLAAMPACPDGLVEAAAVAAMTDAMPSRGDSLHRLVMDLHKALNRLQAELARETLDGAAVYGLADEDRPRLAAFMAGLNRTAPLKFAHPGLGTTATRAGGRLVIQNDIGTTDAHVIVVTVAGFKAQITYADVHPRRLAFLRAMLARFEVSWGAEETRQVAGLAGGAPFHLAIGVLEAAGEEELRAYLNFLGSRLVFLIDWNRARKQLRGFLRAPERVAALEWAAGEEIGHRGFLELGGAALINQAIETASGGAMHFGDRLCDVLGDAAATELVRFALRIASEGLRARQSLGLIRDRVRAELQTHFQSEGRRLLRLASEHAGLVFEIATLVRDGISAATTGDGGLGRRARRAGRFEHEADLLVVQMREAVRRRPDHEAMLRLLEAADDAADQLEEAAFLLELLTEAGAGGGPLACLAALADLLVENAEEWIKALGHAAAAAGDATHEDADDFLVAIDRVLALEHAADDAERRLRLEAVQQAGNFRQLYLYAEVGRVLEEAADALKHAGLIARDVMLGA